MSNNHIQTKRSNGFFSQPSETTTTNTNNTNTFQFNNLFHDHPSTGLQYTNDELLESLIQPIQLHHHQPIIQFPNSPHLTQPISFDHFNNPLNDHHQPIPINNTNTPQSPSPSTNPAQSPSTTSSLSNPNHQQQQHHHTLRSSRSPNPKPLLNRRPQQLNYPFSPPTSITTTLAEDEPSPSLTHSSTHHLSSSQPITISSYRSLASADETPELRSPFDQMNDNLSLSSSLPAPRTFSPHTIIDQQKLVLNEKRRKRRESHNAVERRRRDNINDRITELANLLPACLLDTVVTPNESGMMMVVNEEPSPTDDPQALNSTASHTKPNKGMILAKSVDYIKHLKHLLELQSQRNTELETELKNYRSSTEPHLENNHQQPENQNGTREVEDQQNLRGEQTQGSINQQDTNDQIHQWINIHHQQPDPHHQNQTSLEDQNMMITNDLTDDTHPHPLDENHSHPHHLPHSAPSEHYQPSTSQPVYKHHHHHSSSSPNNHFTSPFNLRLGSIENIYYHLQ